SELALRDQLAAGPGTGTQGRPRHGHRRIEDFTRDRARRLMDRISFSDGQMLGKRRGVEDPGHPIVVGLQLFAVDPARPTIKDPGIWPDMYARIDQRPA